MGTIIWRRSVFWTELLGSLDGLTDGPTLKHGMTRNVSISAAFVSLAQSVFAFDQGKELAEAPLKEKAARLASESSERSIRILQLWLDGELVYWGEGGLVRGIKEAAVWVKNQFGEHEPLMRYSMADSLSKTTNWVLGNSI